MAHLEHNALSLATCASAPALALSLLLLRRQAHYTHAPPVVANKTGNPNCPLRGEVSSADSVSGSESHAERSVEEIPSVPAHSPAQPTVALAPDHRRARLVQHRSARWQPGAVRA